MKKLVALLSPFFILYIIYFDLKVGTLPIAESAAKTQEDVITQTASTPSKLIKIQPGDTVLSIIETINPNYRISSIDTLINDFEALNPNVKADLLQIGKTYYFPLYTN
ncbi:hypothetical protein [Fredinandcohnia quinoae]|uniref:LysM domain-containing protein n=1 Tax=Fredinandcohnia quinoae TaxID=2918902 RepID=A0AAW5DWD0_9BACI|nr:hypothetical protein [Fredinandcohnia sp. SECRCQ15]MCH1624947.1 hypothetical protein [Fredinandcohnia sp. SECRCQ15]